MDMTPCSETEINSLFNNLILRYPHTNGYVNYSKGELEIVVKGWYEDLKDYPKILVGSAVKQLRKTMTFMPNVSNIISRIKEIQKAYTENPEEVWNKFDDELGEICRTAPKLHYAEPTCTEAKAHLKSIYQKMPVLIKDWLGAKDDIDIAIGRMVGIANYDETQLSVAKAQFLKRYAELNEQMVIRRETTPELERIVRATLPDYEKAKPIEIENTLKQLK